MTVTDSNNLQVLLVRLSSSKCKVDMACISRRGLGFCNPRIYVVLQQSRAWTLAQSPPVRGGGSSTKDAVPTHYKAICCETTPRENWRWSHKSPSWFGAKEASLPCTDPLSKPRNPYNGNSLRLSKTIYTHKAVGVVGENFNKLIVEIAYSANQALGDEMNVVQIRYDLVGSNTTCTP